MPSPASPYRIDDLALASRLSFFLWSSIPDDTLLNLAAQGKLKDPAVLEQQVKRMLADPKAEALADNFAEQWLFLRNLKNSAPNLDAFPDFDDNLRQAMLEETKLFFESIQREDRSVMDLLNADYTFVNERLAQALRDSQRLWKPVPARSGDRPGAPGTAGAGQYPHCDLVSQSHFAGPARQVDPDQHPGHAAYPAASECARIEQRTPRVHSRNRCASAWRRIAPMPSARAVTK